MPGLGNHRIKKLLTAFHSINNIFSASKKQLQSHQLTDEQIHFIKNPPQHAIQLLEKWLENSNTHHFISFLDARYPTLLKEIAVAPLVLYAQGDITTLNHPQIALVGSRNPSYTGLELANEFAHALTQAGLHITSGLALGIDAASHKGAIQAKGKTIAVLGSGLLQLYPKQNRLLAEKISENGCVISELPLNMKPLRENFPRRNRIISGLSLGTLVVEAALKSGSLITAKYALEQNRDVFAIPGSLRNPTSKGCLTLIQEGAKCVIQPEDILNEIHYLLPSKTPSHTTLSDRKIQNCHSSGLDCSEQLVLACIEPEVTSVDQICTRSKLSAQIVTSALLQLEITGAVKVQSGGYIKI
ncbi:MAG: DNA-protecting protein DprA [Gammaproteobacteria bacterium CG_4_10_14_0_8_um_filter_38_16]|nr:MAG: DNA-protecting protein DprA [Gammaproteobacteria bacterium CG_4_10_14_0_8_um_filter_38_16]PJA03701.1 MAG: DNA-protecting protein DprA [Gammaproteobacteria bacterium CG_4_10_14_0_2_um_filter_38_22]PJB11356.1 MAG: DNA-protecting protein DprA [Gammaproteobacteria bacterium CG_4_9_14_3_um_filter_38_9]